MLNIGDYAPSFDLPDETGSIRHLEEFLARGSLLLYFYPADFTPVCTREACAFRDRFHGAGASGLNIVGISSQSSASHARFRARYSIPFPLLADETRAIARAYGCTGPLDIGTRRVSFIIGPDGLIKARAVARLRVGPHEALLSKLVAQSP